MIFEEEVDQMMDQDEKHRWFEKRTHQHIKRVQRFCKKIHAHDPDRFDGIIARGEIHDASKFEDPELDPYIHIAWRYKTKRDGGEYKVDPELEAQMNRATQHHVLTNPHHPEYHAGEAPISMKNRDRSDKMVDASGMGILDIAEMVADWAAMSEELGDDPYDWAQKNVNHRWRFKRDQEDLIYELLDAIWK